MATEACTKGVQRILQHVGLHVHAEPAAAEVRQRAAAMATVAGGERAARWILHRSRAEQTAAEDGRRAHKTGNGSLPLCLQAAQQPARTLERVMVMTLTWRVVSMGSSPSSCSTHG